MRFLAAVCFGVLALVVGGSTSSSSTHGVALAVMQRTAVERPPAPRLTSRITAFAQLRTHARLVAPRKAARHSVPRVASGTQLLVVDMTDASTFVTGIPQWQSFSQVCVWIRPLPGNVVDPGTISVMGEVTGQEYVPFGSGWFNGAENFTITVPVGTPDQAPYVEIENPTAVYPAVPGHRWQVEFDAC
jgi:hypothetical protein